MVLIATTDNFRRFSALRNRGGYFEYCQNDKINNFLNSCLLSIKNCVIGVTNNNPDLNFIEYGFLCTDKFSAESAIYNESDILAISASLPLKIISLTKSVITNRNYSNSSEFWQKYRGSEEYSFNHNWMFSDYIKDEFLLVSTGDQQADHLIRSVSEIAIRFIGLHEFFHIAAGHTRWINASFGITCIADGADSCDGNSSNLIESDAFKALEWDADCHAIERLIFSSFAALDYKIENGKVYFNIPPYGPYGVYSQTIYIITHAIIISFFFLFNYSKINSQKHPDSLFRFKSAIYYMINICVFRFGINPNIVYNIISSAIEDSKHFWNIFPVRKNIGFEFLENVKLDDIISFPDQDDVYRVKIKYLIDKGLKKRFFTIPELELK